MVQNSFHLSPQPPPYTAPVTTSAKWAVYLGVSWTWCIGMFLPVLLIRDFGFWAFAVFAVPNIVGAAGMGLVFPSAAASERVMLQHRWACLWFSRVTMAYQAFFAAWMLPQLLSALPGGGWWACAVFPLMILFVLAAVRGDRDFSLSTLLVWLLSLAIGVVLWTRHDLILPATHGLLGGASQAKEIAPVCLLGFLFCPYLDLTFHRAFQRACDAGGRLAARGAFLLGFVFVFGAMIALTAFYAVALIEEKPWARALVGVHVLVQLALTIVLHQVEASRLRRAAGHPRGESFWPSALTGAALGALALVLARQHLDFAGWQIGEYLYRAFLAMYGLVFPVYVLFMVLPSVRMSWMLMIFTVLAATPSYAAGFMTANPGWLVFGFAVVALGFITSLWQAAYVQGRGRRIA